MPFPPRPDDSMTEAARRLTSHSHRAGDVSSKSLMSKMIWRSGGGKASEIREVTVATGLHVQSGARRPRQVRGHHAGGAAIECERRLQHPAIADRHQLLHPAGVRFVQDVQGVQPAFGCLPAAMLLARKLVAKSLAGCGAIVRGNDVRFCACGRFRPRLRSVAGTIHHKPGFANTAY